MRTFEQIKEQLDGMMLIRALWWFIENVNGPHPHRSLIVEYLRGRVKRHEETGR